MQFNTESLANLTYDQVKWDSKRIGSGNIKLFNNDIREQISIRTFLGASDASSIISRETRQ